MGNDILDNNSDTLKVLSVSASQFTFKLTQKGILNFEYKIEN